MEAHPRWLRVVLIAALVAAPLAAARAAGGADDPRVRRGRIHYKSGKYNEAISELRHAVRVDNRNGEAHLWLGKAYARISEFEKAVEHLKQAAALKPESEDALYELGAAYLELSTRARAQGEIERADDFLTKAGNAAKTLLQRNPAQKESYEFLASLARHHALLFRAQHQFAKEQDAYDEALKYCNKVLDLDPNDVSTHLDRIRILFDQKRYKECERACREVLKINPQLHAPKLFIAQILRARGDRQGALKVLTEILEGKKTQIEARLRRAELYLDLQRYEEALADANEVIRLTNKNPYANFIRGCVYMQLKKLDAAIQELEFATAGMPNHLPSHFWLARCYLIKDRLREAIDQLNTVLKLDPRFTAARLVLASAHMQQGYPDGAITTLLDALHFDPKNVEVRRLLGVAYLHKGEPDKAEEQFQKMLELDPEAARAHQVLAGLNLAKGKIDEAIHHCNEALKVEPKNVDVRFLLGLAYMRRRRLDGAKAQFEEVLRLRGRHPGARLNLAAVHVQLKEFDLAEEQYRKCIEDDPTLTKPRYNLARLYVLQRKFDKAEGELAQLLKIARTKPEQAKVQLALAELFKAKGEKDKAVQAAKTALSLDPKTLAARVFLARHYVAEQNWSAALTELDAALKEDPKFAPAYEAATIQVFLGRYEEAIQLFEKAVTNDVNPVQALCGVAVALQLRGDYRGALANIVQADDRKPRDPLITLLTANIYLAQGDATNSRTLLKRGIHVPESIRTAYVKFIDQFVQDKARARALSDALSRVIFFGSRGWYQQAEQNCNIILKLAPDNTFPYSVLANVYLASGKPDKEVEVLKRLVEVAPKDYRHHLRLARRLLALGRFKEARAAFRKAVEVAPEDEPEPRLQLGGYFLRMAQYDLAAEQAKLILEKSPRNPRALALMAACQLAERRLELAKKTLTTLTDSKEALRGALPFIQLAELDLLEGRLDRAIEKYRKAVETNPRSIPARMGLGRALGAKGDLSGALEQFKEALAIDSTYAPALLELSKVYRSTNRLDLAIQCCERAIGIAPSAIEPRYELAAIRAAQGKFGDAIEEYNKILKERPGDFRARIGIAQTKFQQGDQQGAIALLLDLLKERRPLPPAQLTLVGFYKRTGDIDKAQVELEELVKAAPDSPAAYDLAVLYVHKDKLDDAIALLERLIKTRRSAFAVFARGITLQLAGRLDDAIKALTEARKLNPENPRLASYLANALLAAGKPEEARKAMQDSKLDPQLAAAYEQVIKTLASGDEKARLTANILNQAALYADAGWLTLARDLYDRLLTTIPNNVALLHLAATIHERLGERDKAIETYNAMLAAAPGYGPALRGLASHYIAAKDYEKALTAYRAILEKKPDDIATQLSMATLLQEAGKTQESVDLYNKILKRDPNNPIALNNLAWIHATKTKNLKKAEELATRAADLTDPDSVAGGAIRDTLAWIYYITDRYDKATKAARQAVNAMPGNPEVHYHLGMIYLRRGLRASAARHLVTVLKLDPEFKHKAEVEEALERIRKREP